MLRSIRTSIAMVSISGTLPEKLQAIKAAGFDGVEIFENDLLYFDGTPGDVRRMCEDLGLAIYLFQPFRDFEGVSAERLARNVERAKRKFELMHELGTDRMLACSNVSPDMIRDDALIVDQLGVLARTAEEASVIVAYEALAWDRHVFSYKHAWKLVDAVNHPNLGLALDTFARHLPYAVDPRFGGQDRVDSGRAHRVRADCRCTRTRDGCARMEPPLPVLSGAGRVRCRGLHGVRARSGLQGAAVARNLQ